MKTETKKLTFAAICAAIIIVLLYLGAAVKTGTLAIYFITSLTVMTVIDKAGIKSGIMIYAVSALLAAILLPDKNMATAYVLLFGLYPIIKAFAEKCKIRAIEWVIKLIFFNLSFALCCGIIVKIIGGVLTTLPIPVLWICANVFIIFYDILLSFGYTRLRELLKNI